MHDDISREIKRAEEAVREADLLQERLKAVEAENDMLKGKLSKQGLVI